MGEVKQRFASITLDRATLYHGNVDGLKTLQRPEEKFTLGNGVYLTSFPDAAKEYALLRTGSRGGVPTVYTVEVSGKFLDLRDDREFVRFLKEAIKPELESVLRDESIPWFKRDRYEKVIDAIEAGRLTLEGQVECLVWHISEFTEIVKSHGFDGLVAMEGGERTNTLTHDSWVVFEPEKVKIVRSVDVKNSNKPGKSEAEKEPDSRLKTKEEKHKENELELEM